jgi:hypothetical protein
MELAAHEMEQWLMKHNNGISWKNCISVQTH